MMQREAVSGSQPQNITPIPGDTVTSIKGFAFLDLVILSMLESVPMTGYVLKKRLVSQFRLKASYGTLYPKLRSLEKEGIIRSSKVRGGFASRSSGISYELTAAGKKSLESNLQSFDGFLRRIRQKEFEADSQLSASRY